MSAETILINVVIFATFFGIGVVIRRRIKRRRRLGVRKVN